jgi:predicted esterase
MAGEPLDQAVAAMLLLHGRGATAEDILSLADELPRQGFAFLAPQAAQNTWYPNRFMAPTQSNEPWLSSALALVGACMDHIQSAGILPEKTIILGFSQGGCLGLEWAARNAQLFGGLVGLSAGLVGAEGEPRQDKGNLSGTPVFLGCSDEDFHIPKKRVEQTAEILSRLGGQVTLRFYPGLGHTVNQDEINHITEMVQRLTA